LIEAQHEAITQAKITAMNLRNATISDFATILNLNEASVHFLSPLTEERLTRLHRAAAYHRVLERDGEVMAFLLAFREGADYDSVNYRWFNAKYPRFLYIDRVVVAHLGQGQGLGARLYADLFAFARLSEASCVTCEFDIDPPNETSRKFHAKHGFTEVGSQWISGGKKCVSMQAVAL
jgi:uncharacterized protein